MNIKRFPHYKQHDTSDCGPTSLRMVAKFYGMNYSAEMLRKHCHISRRGVNMLGVSKGAGYIGFDTVGMKMTFEQLADEGVNAIFSDEGYVALFGGTKMRLNSDVEKLERTIYVAKADFETGIIDEEHSTLIVVDSTYMPIQISSKNCIIRFSAFENGNFSCLVDYGDEAEWAEYDGFNLGSLNTFNKTSTRSLATGGVSDFTIANALKALDFINGLKGCFQSTSMKECVSEGVGIFSNFIPNDEASVTGGLISAGLTKSLSSGLLSILSYAGDKIVDGPLRSCFKKIINC